MPKTLKQLNAELEIGMEMEQLEALLPEIFAVVQSGAEQPLEVATVFRDAISCAAEIHERISPAAEQTILDWVKAHWATTPTDYFKKLCAILVNLKTDQARVFMEEQQAAATDEQVKAHLAYSLRNRTPANPVA
jgi:hypothetical protein